MCDSMIYFRELTADDASLLTNLLLTSNDTDRTYFNPFRFDALEIRGRIEACKIDVFYGISIVGVESMAGFYMLRGLDEGYVSPVFGVFISSGFRGNGLGRLSLCHAMSVCKLKGYTSLLLKVHKSNHAAASLYLSLGFKPIRFEADQIVMENSINSSRT